MARKLRNVWNRLISFENLFLAWEAAARGKRYTLPVLKFGANLEEKLFLIQDRLRSKTWRPGPWREFISKEPKLRLIQAPPFADRIVHHALCNLINPVFERRFIQDSYACRKRKGTHAAGIRLTDFLRRHTRHGRRVYVLKADIKSYFPSIDHDILMQIVEKNIADRDILWLVSQIVKNNGFSGTGLPIGALTSQLFANAYLDIFDHYVKDCLGVKYYVRYMDDFVVVSDDKGYLSRLVRDLEEFLEQHLHLCLNPKTCIFPASHGVDFAGYRHWATHRLPRKRNLKRTRKKFRSMTVDYRMGLIDVWYVRDRVMSFTGYIKHCNAYRSAGSVLGDLVLCRGEVDS